MAHEFDILVILHEIRELLKKQNEILEKQQQSNSQTKITVVGNKVQNQIPKGLKNDDDFTL